MMRRPRCRSSIIQTLPTRYARSCTKGERLHPRQLKLGDVTIEKIARVDVSTVGDHDLPEMAAPHEMAIGLLCLEERKGLADYGRKQCMAIAGFTVSKSV